MKANGTATHLVNTSFEDWREMKNQMRSNLVNKIIQEKEKMKEIESLDYNDSIVSILHSLHTIPLQTKQEILSNARNPNTQATCTFSLINSREYSNKGTQLTNDLAHVIDTETEGLLKNICPGIETRGISVYVEESNQTPGLFYTVIQYVYILMSSQIPVEVQVPEPPKPKRNKHKNRRRNQAAAAAAASLEVPGVPVASDLVEDLHDVDADEDPC
jgi:hypothetical protein